GYPPGGAAGVRQSGRTCFDPDIALKLSSLVEHLDAVALPVADVDQPVIAERDAMDNPGEYPSHSCPGLLFRRLAAPLTQELSGLVEHHDAPVTIAISDVDVAIGGIDGD